MTSFVLGWVLQATIVASVATIVTLSGRRWSPRARHAVLSVGLAAFLVPPLVPVPSLLSPLDAIDAVVGARWLELAVPSGGLRLVVTIWLAGVGFAVAVIVAQAGWLARVRRVARCHDRGMLQPTVGRLARTIGLEAVPHVFVSERVPAPFVCGAFRPAILLPAATVRRLTPRDLEFVLAHELAHLGQGDLWLNVLRALTCAVWWPHPLVWIVGRVSRRLREEACDDLVLAGLGVPPREYARSLVEAAAATAGWRHPSLLAVGVSESGTLPGRIGRLFDPAARRARRLSGLQRAAVVAFAAVAWSAGSIDVRSGRAPFDGTVFVHVGGSPPHSAHHDHGLHAGHPHR